MTLAIYLERLLRMAVLGRSAAFVQAILPAACRLVVAAPGKHRRGPDEGLTPGEAIAAEIAMAVGADPKECVPLGEVIVSEM
jgi:hypothetical protein